MIQMAGFVMCEISHSLRHSLHTNKTLCHHWCLWQGVIMLDRGSSVYLWFIFLPASADDTGSASTGCSWAWGGSKPGIRESKHTSVLTGSKRNHHHLRNHHWNLTFKSIMHFPAGPCEITVTMDIIRTSFRNFEPYMMSRLFKVSWRGGVCKSYQLTTGVPQSPVLGPLVFLDGDPSLNNKSLSFFF